ncbi:hypothetical protein RRG40_02500 [Mycoplasmopsis felis]|uniref:Mbov_0401 family ICE element transposase-like protein n=1 Tax=Mycoplasmopsis felis TaxID=33923 RepID=UPI002AFF6B6B|nr:hypothetical protein [Mycoplasmopsis felis]WQQ05269.1 hypothetical protein RRG59_02835 [Mycoplasmopsis felis]
MNFINNFFEKNTLKINQWNKEEEYFRKVILKQNKKYIHWRKQYIRLRKIIISGKVYQYKLGVYLDKKTGKKFTYYHNEEVKKIGKLKYYPDDLVVQYLTKNYKRRSSCKGLEIPLDVIKYHIKKGNLQIKNNENNEKNKHKNLVNIGIDDTYFKVNFGKIKKKICLRLVILESKNNHKTMLLFDVSKYKTNEISLIIKSFLDEKIKRNNIIINADAANVFTKIANEIGGIRSLDKFHFVQKMWKVFGFTCKKFKKNKEFFIENKLINEVNLLLKSVKNNNFWLMKSLIFYIKNLVIDKKIEGFKVGEIKSFIRYFKKNEGYIYETFTNRNVKNGQCEYHINQYIKSPIFKRFSLFSWGVIKERINDYYKLKNSENSKGINIHWFLG